MPKGKMQKKKQQQTKNRNRNTRKNSNRTIKKITNKVKNGRTKDIRIVHDGILENISISNGASASSGMIACNPGLAEFNEWLSKLATLYEQYTIHKVTFRWVPSLGQLSNGTVWFGFETDASDPQVNIVPEVINQFQKHCQTQITKPMQMTLLTTDTSVPYTKYVNQINSSATPFHDYNYGSLYYRVDYTNTSGAAMQVGYISYTIDLSLHKPGPVSVGDESMQIYLKNPGVVNTVGSNFDFSTIWSGLQPSAQQIVGSLPLSINQATGVITVLEDLYMAYEVVRQQLTGAGYATGLDGLTLAQGTGRQVPILIQGPSGSMAQSTANQRVSSIQKVAQFYEGNTLTPLVAEAGVSNLAAAPNNNANFILKFLKLNNISAGIIASTISAAINFYHT